MVLSIQIKRIDNGNLAAIYETEGKAEIFNALFEFANWGGVWYFWLAPGWRASHTFEGVFPVSFFLDACRAVYCLSLRGGFLPDGAEITKGGDLLK